MHESVWIALGVVAVVGGLIWAFRPGGAARKPGGNAPYCSNAAVCTTRKVIFEGHPVLMVELDDADWGAWCCCDVAEPEDRMIVAVDELLERHPDVWPVMERMPLNTIATRSDGNSTDWVSKPMAAHEPTD